MSKSEVPNYERSIEDLLRAVKKLLVRCAILLTIVFVVVVALQYQILRRNKQLDTIQDTAAASQAASEQASQDLNDAIEQSRSGSSSSAGAIQVIYVLKEILCEVFPNTVACQQPSE